MIKKSFYIAAASGAAAVLLVNQAFALDQIIRPYQGIRGSAMGGVRMTTGLYDENFFGNAARVTANPIWRVTVLDVMAETNRTTLSTIDDLTSGGDVIQKVGSTAGKNNHARVQTAFPAVYIPHLSEKMSLGFAILTSTQADVALRKNYQLDPEMLTDIGPALTLGHKFLENDALSIGLTTHLTYRMSSRDNFSFVDIIKGASLSPTKSGGEGAHLDFDFGATYMIAGIKPLGFDINTAFTVNNMLGGRYQHFNIDVIDTKIDAKQQPETWGVGLSASRKDLFLFDDSVFALEFTDIGNNPDGSLFRTLHMGSELRYGMLSGRFGLNQGYIAAGFGIDLKFFTLDVATYGEEMGLSVGDKQDRRTAAKIAFHI